MADQRKALTRGASEYTIYRAASDASSSPDFSSSQSDNRAGDNFCLGKVELMNRAVDRVYFNRGDYVKAGLFESKAETASAGKDVNSDRSFGMFRCRVPKQVHAFLFLSMNLTNLGVSFFVSFSSHCQIVSVRQPSA